MRRKVKKPQKYLYLTQVKRPECSAGHGESSKWQSLDPGADGEALTEKIKALAREGESDCFIFTAASLKGQIYNRLPFWIQQLKLEYPQMDIHIYSGRFL